MPDHDWRDRAADGVVRCLPVVKHGGAGPELGNRVGHTSQPQSSSTESTITSNPLQPIVCLIRGHIPGRAVMVRGFASSACVRCNRTIELAGPDVDPLGLFLRPSRGLHDLTERQGQARPAA